MANRYFVGSRLSDKTFRLLCKYFCENIPASQAARLVSVNRSTAQSIYGKLRVKVCEIADVEAEELIGEIEIDEADFGPTRVRGKRGRGTGKKIPVIGILKRDGRVFTQVIENCTAQQI